MGARGGVDIPEEGFNTSLEVWKPGTDVTFPEDGSVSILP
ncbi:MAG: hypothetical protein PWQ80_468 [Thermotoga sp.]|nr:hypothetical protein [Thermotoga sp.]